ncbi:TPA: FAD:protein FMN transferase [Photobacterium damselae]
MFVNTKKIQPSKMGCAALAVSISLLLSGCNEPPKLEKITGFAEGTTYHVTYWAKDDVPVTKVQAQFDKRLAEIDKEFSTYRNDSYISEFNHSASTQWQPASKEFIDLVALAKTINKDSGGCYDPTIQPLYKLWGFQGDKLHVPTHEEITTIQGDMGINNIEIDPTHLKIRKVIPQVQIDLSSMGEGFAISQLSKILEADGINNYLVEFGGDMKIKGHKPNGVQWRVAIEQPISLKEGVKPYQVVTIFDQSGVSLNTSGTYHHNFEQGKKEYSHILDPRTGSPITHNLVSASVFGNDPIKGDAWATTMLCLGPKQGMEAANKLNLPVFFIQDEEGKFISSSSDKFKETKAFSMN